MRMEIESEDDLQLLLAALATEVVDANIHRQDRF